jgi:hypothetical protein
MDSDVGRILSDTIPTSFWSIFEILRDSSLSRHLQSLIKDQHMSLSTEGVQGNISTLSAHPLFQSFSQEITRLRMSKCIHSTNAGDSLRLDGNWIIPNGANVLIFSQDLALDAETWVKARPRSVAKPLEEFWAERFMTTSDFNSKKRGGNTLDKMPKSDALSGLNIAFRTAEGRRPEEDLIRGVQAGTLSVLLTEYEMQLSDPESAERAIPPLREGAFGTVKPLGKIRMRLRKRTPLNAAGT